MELLENKRNTYFWKLTELLNAKLAELDESFPSDGLPATIYFKDF